MTFLNYIFALFKKMSEVPQLDVRESQTQNKCAYHNFFYVFLSLAHFFNNASFKSWAKPMAQGLGFLPKYFMPMSLIYSLFDLVILCETVFTSKLVKTVSLLTVASVT